MRLAARGLRDLNGTVEPITDADELAAVQRQAARVRLRVIFIATIVTTLFVLLGDPGLLR